MEKIIAFLSFQEGSQNLPYASSFTELLQSISWLALIIVGLWSLRWLPPFNNVLASIRNDIYSELSESELIQELIPRFQHRCQYYRVMLWGMVAIMLAGYTLSIFYGGYAVAALTKEYSMGSRLTVFSLLSALSALMFFVGFYFMKEAHRLASFLRRVIF